MGERRSGPLQMQRMGHFKNLQPLEYAAQGPLYVSTCQEEFYDDI